MVFGRQQDARLIIGDYWPWYRDSPWRSIQTVQEFPAIRRAKEIWHFGCGAWSQSVSDSRWGPFWSYIGRIRSRQRVNFLFRSPRGVSPHLILRLSLSSLNLSVGCSDLLEDLNTIHLSILASREPPSYDKSRKNWDRACCWLEYVQ